MLWEGNTGPGVIDHDNIAQGTSRKTLMWAHLGLLGTLEVKPNRQWYDQKLCMACWSRLDASNVARRIDTSLWDIPKTLIGAHLSLWRFLEAKPNRHWQDQKLRMAHWSRLEASNVPKSSPSR